jgi:hypothetical protein
MSEPTIREPHVYLAHATEDKGLAEPLARGLMARGIDVWYDSWEIRFGDSLVRKMGEGLVDCTHFIVLLTEKSIQKPWVNEEIDSGLMSAVEGKARFIGLRYKLPLSALTPFLRTKHTPEFELTAESLETLEGEIFGISKKPPLGEKPSYVRAHRADSKWSDATRSVAGYFIRNSKHAGDMDPEATYEAIQKETGLPMPDLRIAVLDLVEAGLLDKAGCLGGGESIWPSADLFINFDAEFMGWSPEKDGRDLAVFLQNRGADYVDAREIGAALGWQPRRFNPAAAYLVSAKAVRADDCTGISEYWPIGFYIGDELLRFVRSE